MRRNKRGRRRQLARPFAYAEATYSASRPGLWQRPCAAAA